MITRLVFHLNEITNFWVIHTERDSRSIRSQKFQIQDFKNQNQTFSYQIQNLLINS